MIIYELRRLAGTTKRGGDNIPVERLAGTTKRGGDNIPVETAGWGHQERW